MISPTSACRRMSCPGIAPVAAELLGDGAGHVGGVGGLDLQVLHEDAGGGDGADDAASLEAALFEQFGDGLDLEVEAGLVAVEERGGRFDVRGGDEGWRVAPGDLERLEGGDAEVDGDGRGVGFKPAE